MEWTAALSSFLGAAVGVLASLATERLRARVSGQFWLAEERWKLKAENYSRLLRLLTTQVGSMRRVVTVLQQGRWESGPLPAALEERVAPIIKDAIVPTAAEMREVVAVARLWLRADTVTTLEEAAHSMSPPYYLGLLKKTADALERSIALVVAAAQKDLKLDVEGVQSAA